MSTILKLLIVTVYFGIWTRNHKPVDGARILALAPFGAKSHWNFMQGILRASTDHGHRVTVFTPFPDGDRENYTEIDLSEEVKIFTDLDVNVIETTFYSYADLIHFIYTASRNTCKMLYENDSVKNIIADRNSDYDVLLVEIRMSECLSYLAAKLNVPLIYVTPPPIISYIERSILGHYPNPAVVSHTAAEYGVPKTFVQRIENTLLLAYTSSLFRYKYWSTSIADPQPFDLTEPVKPSILFSNAHCITDAARPLTPNVIQVGGIHLNPPKPIPNDILEFIENSPNGVIIFTLGSVVAVSSLPKQTQEAIIEVLGNVPQRVLLKYEDKVKVKLPKNIMAKKWFPQRDILLHPSVKLFISHGGVSGIYEAVDAGVPVLGFPIFFDQIRNIENLKDAGMAISMDIKSISKYTFMESILKLINDEKYMINAKKASELFNDRPLSPANLVDYWIRYVIRHKGAAHIKSQALNLTWYQYFLLDVIAVFLLLFLLIVYIPYKLFRTIHVYYFQKVKLNIKTKLF